jgi:hypothetical protein
MTRTVWVVILALILIMGGIAVVNTTVKSVPHQEAARLVRVPTERVREVIVPPCGTGTPVTSTDPKTLAKTPGTIAFFLQKDRGDRLVVLPRCQAAQGAKPSEGTNLPSAAFVLPIGALVTAGRAGSAEAGTEKVESQLVVPANSSIKTIVVTRCLETEQQAQKFATGRSIILNPQRGRPDAALAPPC